MSSNPVENGSYYSQQPQYDYNDPYSTNNYYYPPQQQQNYPQQQQNYPQQTQNYDINYQDYYYDEGEEEEEIAAERELAEDAQWKMIQKNTFTRWANEHLKLVNSNVTALDEDLSDGLKLVALLEILSGKKFTKYNKKPNFRTQKLENVTMCLKYLEVDEGIKIVNIDSTDIVDHKLKLILGLIWTLILHYSICMPTWDNDEAFDPKTKTPKQRLLSWIQSKIPEKNIQNFTSDWNDGTAIAALVDALAPGLCPDSADMKPENAVDNATQAMDAAEQWMDVPQLIHPVEMCNPKVDEMSMMTYLSQYPNAKLKQNAPLKVKINPNRVKSYGPGIEPYGNTQGNPARFIVETVAAGTGEPEIIVVNSAGAQEPCEKIYNNDRAASFNCVYTPSMAGPYTVHVRFAGKETPKSPYLVNVEARPGNAAKVTACGPGVEKTGVMVNRKTYFEVHTKFAGGVGVVDVGVLDPTGRCDIIKPIVARKSDDLWYVEYTPFIEGLHSVNVSFAGTPIPASPYPVHVSRDGAAHIDPSRIPPGKLCAPLDNARASLASPTGKPAGCPAPPAPVVEPVTRQLPQAPFAQTKAPPSVDPRKCFATGRGIQPKGVRLGDDAVFKVHTRGAGDGDLAVKVLGPGGVEERVNVRKLDPVTYLCNYVPRKAGPHAVVVNYGGQSIPKSPFKVDVGPIKHSRIVAFGPGLETGMVGYPACFTVETNGETGALGFSIEGPSQAKIDCKDNGDGSADVSYWPTAPGEYAVHILCDEEDIPKSPYMADIRPLSGDFDPTKVEAHGQGLERNGNIVHKWTEFTVDARRAGKAILKVFAMDVDYHQVEIITQEIEDRLYLCKYQPRRAVKHTILISYGGLSIPRSPFRVYVEESSDPSKVKVYGPALDRPTKTFQPTFLIVDCSQAGPGDVAIALSDEKGVDTPVRTTDNGDNTFRIDFTPTTVGMYTANVFFADQEIPSSPYKIKVDPSIDVSRVRVEGLEERVPVGKEVDFDIVTSGAGKGRALVNVKEPSGKIILAKIEETIDGFAAKFTPAVPGPHVVQVKYEGFTVPLSPFRTTAFIEEKPVPKKGNPLKVKAYGPGLSGGKINTPCEFSIDTREAGPGGLGLAIEGPCEAKIDCFDKGNGTCDVKYWPTEPGDYLVNISYDEAPIVSSPFKAKITPNVDVSSIRVYGPGLQPTGIFLDSTTDFTVDASQVVPKGPGKVKAILTSPSGAKSEALVNNNNDGTFKCFYTPNEQGIYTIEVTYESLPVPRSPFKVNIVPGCDPAKVRAYGPGLEGGYTNQPQIFKVETKGAGQGGLGLSIEGPSEAKMNCRDNRDGSCTVEYLPTKQGDYDITIKFAEQEIPGSPFKVHIADEVNPDKVSCYGPGIEPLGPRKGKPGHFVVDASRAGVAPLEVATLDSKGHRKPAKIKSRGDGLYDVEYHPDVEGPLKVDVKYAGKPVPGSPFHTRICPSFEAGKVKVTGNGIKPTGVLATLPTDFAIDTREAGVANLDVYITDPHGKPVSSKCRDNNDGTYAVTYTPNELGMYVVGVRYGGNHVPHSPFNVHTSPAGDASKCRILDGVRTTIPVGEECVINIATAEAGYGNITCHIRSTNGSDVDIDIVDNEDGTVSVLYTPRVPGAYTINLKFGGQPIPHGHFTQQATEKPIYVPDEFKTVDLSMLTGPVFAFVDAAVTTPSGQQERPTIEDNGDGTVKLRYCPVETGLHQLQVAYNHQPIQGSPFFFYVHPVNRGIVTAHGPGLTYGINNQPCPFTIITKDAGTGGLALAVEGPSKAEISCSDNKDGTCSVFYLPTAPGEYNIIIKFADQHIPGSPFTAKVVTPYVEEETQKKAYISVGTSSEVSLKVSEADISSLTANIRSPSGFEEPCLLKKLPNGHLGISFTPREVGDYLVNVYRHGNHIPNSPFKIYVGESEVGRADRVRVYGRGLIQGRANTLNEFFVDTRDAGYGGLSLSVEGPSKADIDCVDNEEDGSCRVAYRPTEPGDYLVNIKFADEHVPGSPFMVRIDGDQSMSHRILRQRDCADVTHVGSECELSLKIPGTNRWDMQASVCSPSGITEQCNIDDLGDGHYSIKFVPNEMGIHTVNVKHRGMHIPGSPFQFTVGPITDGGAHKVRAMGPGLCSGDVSKSNHFSIYTREAGAGGLSIAVEGPSKAEIDFDDRKDGSCDVSYRCQEPGEYLVSIKFNDQHIPDSPFRVFVSGDHLADHRRLFVRDLQEHGWQINKPAAFTVDFNGAQGRLDARVIAPSGNEDQAIIQEVEKDRYAVRFTPRESGVHMIEVRLDGARIQGSPFRVVVGRHDADPSLVNAFGEGLFRGYSGKLSRFRVNTGNGGSGALAVTIDGPSKVQLACKEVEEGYEFWYTPTAAGDYIISIKYGDHHIPNSPFKAHVDGPTKNAWSEQSQVVLETVTKSQQKFSSQATLPSDHTKVKVQGQGLKTAYANKETTFTVDTTDAGYNMLMVGVLGPEIPCEEVKVKHIGECLYSVNYMVHDPGNYVLVVKWGDKHIPGSPFHITVV